MYLPMRRLALPALSAALAGKSSVLAASVLKLSNSFCVKYNVTVPVADAALLAGVISYDAAQKEVHYL